MRSRYEQAIQAFDEANSQDPNKETLNGREYPKELLYAQRMTRWLDIMCPDASEALRLAARCQHIERWSIPRETYPMDRTGYIRWRNELKKYHADRAESILNDAGYDEETVMRVKDLVRKKGLKSDTEVQILEDVICLVCLAYYIDEFAAKHDDEKIVDILKKTWRKMSDNGRQMVMKLKMSPSIQKLMERALS